MPNHNHGVRQYSDYVGRFLCPDRLWDKQVQWTPYHYSYNNPVNNSDGNGDIVPMAVAAAIAAGGSGIVEGVVAGAAAAGGAFLIVKQLVGDADDTPVNTNTSIVAVQDATATNIGQLEAETKAQDKQDSKKANKSKNGPKNDESKYFLKAALKAAGIKYTEEIRGDWHAFEKVFKDLSTGNVPREELRELADDFVKLWFGKK